MSPSHGTMSPSHGTIGPSHGTISPSHGTISSSHGTMSPSHGTICPSHGTMSPSLGTISSSHGTKSITWDYRSITWDYKSITWDYKSIKWDYKSTTWDYESITWDYKSIKWDYKTITWDYESITWDYSKEEEEDNLSSSESLSSCPSEISDLPGVKNISEYIDEQSDSAESELAALTTADCETGLRLGREKTRVSLGEFYAPTPDMADRGIGATPDIGRQATSGDTPINENTNNRTMSRCSTKLVIQVPSSTEPQFIDAATSPIAFSSSETDTTGTSESQQIPDELNANDIPLRPVTIAIAEEADIPPHSNPQWGPSPPVHARSIFGKTKPFKDETEKVPINFNFFRSKSCLVHNTSKVVQVSSSTADNFVLPRENTNISSQSIDFTEMELARIIGARKFPKRLLRTGKLTDPSGARPGNHGNHWRSKTEESASVTPGSQNLSHSFHGDISPTTEYVKNHILPYGQEDKRNGLDRLKGTESNLCLQITRSHTVLGPLRANSKLDGNKMHQLQRYRNVHNPGTANVTNTETRTLPKVLTRHVSIPDKRFPYLENESNNLFIRGKIEIRKKPGFSSATSWKDSSDLKHIREASKKICSPASITSSHSSGSKESSDFLHGPRTSNNDVLSADGVHPSGGKVEFDEGSKRVLVPGLSALTDSETLGPGMNCVGTYDLSDIIDTQRSTVFSDTNQMSPRTVALNSHRGHTRLARTIDKSDFTKNLVSVGNCPNT
ncbi:hypothetical protein ScPMuIL_017626 [Solemya velum]